MAEEFGQEDGGDVALVGKLGEDRYRRSAARVLEIDGVHQVAGDGDGIGHDKQPAQPLVEARSLLEVQRQQHECQIDTIDVEQSRSIEYQRAMQHTLEQRP